MRPLRINERLPPIVDSVRTRPVALSGPAPATAPATYRTPPAAEPESTTDTAVHVARAHFADLSIPATSSVPIVSHLYMHTTKNTLPLLPHTCTSSLLVPNIQISYRWTSPAGAAAFLPVRRIYRRSKSYGHCPSYPSASSCSCSQPLSSPS